MLHKSLRLLLFFHKFATESVTKLKGFINYLLLLLTALITKLPIFFTVTSYLWIIVSYWLLNIINDRRQAGRQQGVH